MAALRPVTAAAPDGSVGVAVSGGGDSVALLGLMQAWAAEAGRVIEAVTVTTDCGRRVPPRPPPWRGCAACAASATTLGSGGTQTRGATCRPGRARRAGADRRVGAGARHRRRGARPHARRSGGDLPDAPRPRFGRRRAGRDGCGHPGRGDRVAAAAHRVRRSALRDWLSAEGVAWTEDPGNRRPAFRPGASTGGAGAVGRAGDLAGTAGRHGRSDGAGTWCLGDATAALARECLAQGPAGACFSIRLRSGQRRRSCACASWPGALGWVSGAVYRPRLARLAAAAAAVAGGRIGHGLTLHGCVLARAAAG